MHDIIDRGKATFTRVMLAIAGLSVIGLVPTTMSDNTLNTLSFAHIVVGVSAFILCRYCTFPHNYRLGAAALFILLTMLVTYAVYRAPVPQISGALPYVPTIIFASTLIHSAKFGGVIFVYMILLILGFNPPIPDDLIELGVSRMLVVDRIVAASLGYAVAVVSQRTMNLVIAKIEEQAKEIEMHSKLSALGVFVGGLAHEVNNPLMIINGALRVLSMKLVGKEIHLANPMIEKMQHGIDRIRLVIHGLQFMAGKVRGAHIDSHCTFNQSIDDCMDRLHEKIEKSNVTIDIVRVEHPLIIGTTYHLGSILMVLVDNAIDATASMNPKEVTISVSAESSADELMISVTDNGGGIEESIQNKILDPFFTTKEVGKGSGLGLSHAYGMCRMLKWQLKFQSHPGKTAFTIRIPFDNQNKNAA